ncbi:SHOCT domain-containing protein [Fusobacterium animalis]
MIPPKQETQKERREREERAKREEQEFFNELQKLNGIPLQQEKPVTIIYTKSDGKKFDGKYKPSPKHDPKTGYPGASKSNIPDIETGQELLEDSYGSSKVKQRYVWYRGRLVEFQPGNDGTWHDYTVDGNEVPIDVLRQMRDDGIITNSEYQKLKKGKK